MNRRSFINRLFLFTGAMSSGLWTPTAWERWVNAPIGQVDWQVIPFWHESHCTHRIYSQSFLEALHNDGKPLNIDELLQLCYQLKKARDEAGLSGKIIVDVRPEVFSGIIVDGEIVT